MRIEVFDQQDGLSGEPEVWVQVRSNEIVDWPTVQRGLTPEQREALGITGGSMARRPISYYPALLTAEEKLAIGHRYEDIWIFRKVVAT